MGDEAPSHCYHARRGLTLQNPNSPQLAQAGMIAVRVIRYFSSLQNGENLVNAPRVLLLAPWLSRDGSECAIPAAACKHQKKDRRKGGKENKRTCKLPVLHTWLRYWPLSFPLPTVRWFLQRDYLRYGVGMAYWIRVDPMLVPNPKASLMGREIALKTPLNIYLGRYYSMVYKYTEEAVIWPFVRGRGKTNSTDSSS